MPLGPDSFLTQKKECLRNRGGEGAPKIKNGASHNNLSEKSKIHQENQENETIKKGRPNLRLSPGTSHNEDRDRVPMTEKKERGHIV